ncbi:MAG: hypothetical protein OZSIB_1224 [Candidatus Ozemobacter sibiricus]|uniref:Uncharacterized protein n=1 Tax=Candidatus Ozemobacter sibiricus TaxID=2268124 RepID=A0A367ZLH4_9BACT|nr:MAG: hypothetical protein OZSIB_1224 [Candidatus Ozemobacter sibiricus]
MPDDPPDFPKTLDDDPPWSAGAVSASEAEDERKLDISGTKTFEMKKAEVKGDIGHFSTENYDSIPGFRLDQSLHLEIDGNITRRSRVHAVLDDKDDEDRRFTINIDGANWDLVMGDFPLEVPDTEFVLYKKEVRGIMAVGGFHPDWQTTFLFSQSKGRARREEFRGAGQQQEFRLLARPLVQNSERVTIDDRLLVRGTDYLIDYEDGILKLLPPVLPVEVTSWVVVEYEVTDRDQAFKRNLGGFRVVHRHGRDDRRLGFSWIREMDATTPRSDVTSSGTVRPMDHQIIGFDADWKLTPSLSLAGETAVSSFDPNRNGNETAGDQAQTDMASRLTVRVDGERMDGEVAVRRIGKEFRLPGREAGVTELGERGLVSDLLKETGRVTYEWRPGLQLFGTLERSRTNLGRDPTVPSVKFSESQGGVAWKYGPKARLETRVGLQSDREDGPTVRSDRGRQVGAVVWDHDFGRFYTQSKVEHTRYSDDLHAASGSRVLQLATSIGSDRDKAFTWSVGATRLTLDDDLDPDKLRSETDNWSLDLNYEPNRVLTARGIFQWRTEDDFLVNSRQKDQIADSRFQYQPNRDLRLQLKYKVENTSKVVRDPSLDPTRYLRPPSLPLDSKNKEEVVNRFENPVRKTTANLSLNYQPRPTIETFFDWKRRDLQDRATDAEVSFNDRQTVELRYTPLRQLKLSTEYENGVMRTRAPATEIRDALKKVGARYEFWEGYAIDTRLEEHDENDVLLDENDKLTRSRILEFQRIFSPQATWEAGIQRNLIDYKQPSREWEMRTAFVLTPAARSQRYRFFLAHKQIEAATSGSKLEGGLDFSQVIGVDTMIDGQIKKVKATQNLIGNGYEALVANAKMVITF